VINPSENAQKIANAFDKEASSYHEKFEVPLVPAIMRQIVYQHIARYIKKGDLVLDMNCGPGPDFPFLRSLGAAITGLDVSPAMLAQARARSQGEELILLDYNLVQSLKRQFTVLFSNFGGLNTQADFSGFAEKCWDCLQPNGWLIVNIMTPFPLPEILEGIISRQHFFRRLRQGKSMSVSVGDQELAVHYFWPKRFFKQYFASHFQLQELIGLGIFLPPPYGKYRHKTPSGLQRWLESRWAGSFPFRSWGDHALIIMRAKEKTQLK